MLNEVSVALIGIGGYGHTYLSLLLQHPAFADVRLIAVADPAPNSCTMLPEIEGRSIPIYATLERLLEQHTPDLVIISSPLHLHAEHVIAALDAGCHVLCEKPLCSSPAQAADMLRAQQLSKKQVSIGYQWSFSQAVQDLKRDVLAGLFGRFERASTLVLWPRSEKYYQRNDWAGRRYSKSGLPIFDSPLNNACAHHLHNMLYVLGDAPGRSELPASLTAELYRAYEIETFDTAAVRLVTAGGNQLSCIVSHATRSSSGPQFTFEFEHAVVTFTEGQPTAQTRDGATIQARFADGRIKDYGSPERDPGRKLWAAIASVRTGEPTVCGIEASGPQTLVVAAAQQSMPEAISFPTELIHSMHEGESSRRWVQGLDEILHRCSTEGLLPSEANVAWSVPGQTVLIAARVANDIPAAVLTRDG